MGGKPTLVSLREGSNPGFINRWVCSSRGAAGDEIGSQSFDTLLRGVPSAHEPGRAVTIVDMEGPTALAEGVGFGLGQMDEDGIGLTLKSQTDTGMDQTGFQSSRTLICVAGIAQPRAGFDQTKQRRGHQPHLRRKLTSLLAAVIETRNQIPVEKRTESPMPPPVLEAPRLITSTPQRQLNSAGDTSRREKGRVENRLNIR